VRRLHAGDERVAGLYGADAASVGEVGGKRKLKLRQQYLAKIGGFVGSLQQGEDCLLLSLKAMRKGLQLSGMSGIEELFVRGVVVVLDDTETCFLSEMLSCIPSFTSQRTIKEGMKVENEDVVSDPRSAWPRPGGRDCCRLPRLREQPSSRAPLSPGRRILAKFRRSLAS
jgi:hypothetical protein